MRLNRTPALVTAALVAAASAEAQLAPVLDSATMAGFRWRAVGPANMAGRIADVVGIPGPSKTFYFAAAGGGIWKTTNAGTTFRPVFDNERVISMGALAIAPSDTNQVWAGTGEQNSRNSISPGGGIYKSIDGAKSWRLTGLEATEQIARIVVHPTNPDIVYVAALGHAWGPNPERGLYKTTDGGKSWQLSKFISAKAGFVDVIMHPTDPNTLYASSYERVRGPYFLKSGGPGSALWKTTDGGATWTEIKGGGFPETMKGRIGLSMSASSPNVVYALVEADSVRGGAGAMRAPASDSAAARPTPARRQRLLSGLYRSDDAGRTWRWMNDRDVRPFYYSQVDVDPKNQNRVYWSSTPVQFSDDGGRTVRAATSGIHVDHHALWIDPSDPEHFIVGNDGGIAITWDRGGNYDFPSTIPLGQFYEVSFDMAMPYRVCGGLQDNGSWCGPSRKKNGPITNADWFTVGGGDGFYTAQDPSDPNIIYSESQGGAMGRLNLVTGERVGLIKPAWRPRYLQYEDSVLIERPDTTRPPTREQQQRLAEFRKRQMADSTELDMRWNWNTPFFISPHSPTTFYTAGNRVLKSTARGENLYPISPDLSTKDYPKVRYSVDSTGGITLDATGAETYGTVTTLAESPVRPGLLYAGTDDGNVWLTRNDGATWENLTGRIAGVPAKTYVVRIEPSHFDTATVYVAFENHRNNDFAPYVFVSTDFGKSFRSIAGNLPTGKADFMHVIREDLVNRDLLFAGTDVGAYVSLDRGATWQKFMSGFPSVPVHDLKIHPRDHELIAATHGRSIWIVDIAALQQMKPEVLASAAHLFAPKTAYQWGQQPSASGSPGHKVFSSPSPQYGADIVYRLTSGGRGDRAKILITDVQGDTLRTIDGPGGPGLHRVTWNFQGRTPPPTPLSPAQKRDSIVNTRKIERIFDSLATAGIAPKATLDRLREQMASGGAGLAALFGGGGGGGGGAFVERPGEGPLPGAVGAGGGAGGPGGRGGQGMAAMMADTNVRRLMSDTASRRRFMTDTAFRREAMVRMAASGTDTVAISAMTRGGGAGAMGGGMPAAGEAPLDPAALGPVFDAMRGARITGLFGGGGGFGAGRGPVLVESGNYLVTLTVGGKTMKQVLRVEKASGPTPGGIANQDQR